MTDGKRIFPCLLWGILALSSLTATAQQNLGAITGTVADATGAVLQKASIQVANNDSGLSKSAVSRDDGSFYFPDLPIGTYTLTFTSQGFRKEVHKQVLVQANRTTTLQVKLQPGGGDTSVEVNATPLLNRVDTTNGYIMNGDQIDAVPLGTGSFTQLAVLSPGVSADFLGGTDTNAGLGNQSIWANGQRDTSNSFTVNSILATNLFNGKSSSEVAANRVVLNTGENFLRGGVIQTNTSVYDAIAQSLPSPPQETIQELRVNTSMYDASQGANSGAHIEVQTRSGTNQYHGQLYGRRQSDALNADSFFFKQDGLATPVLHRGTVGGTFGGPIVKDKLFFFTSYQWTSVHDQLNALQQITVPTELTDDRSVTALTNLANTLNGAPITTALDPAAVKLLQFKLPNGQFLIPSAQITNPDQVSGGLSFTNNLFGQTPTFTAHQANGNIDYILNSKDQIFAKYYFQDDPTTSPFTQNDNLLGFPQQLQAGSQVLSLQNVVSLSSNLTWDQKLGFIRQRVFSTVSQALQPSDVGINLFGSNRFPGININQVGDPSPTATGVFGNGLSFGRGSNFSDTGSFQNQLELTSNLHWQVGRHTLSFGGNWDYAQLNIINRASQVAAIDFNSFADFLTGNVRPGFGNTDLFQGPTNRYYRAPQVGLYAQDKWRITDTLNLSFGLRYDWDAGLTEKTGNLINFDPAKYQYNFQTNQIVNDGLVVAGNNRQFGTPGTSDSTLNGRQWGIAPRVGIAWSPKFLPSVVVRSGFGVYFDRGEFFAEFSPSAGGGFNGPFGVTLQPPFVQQVVGGNGGTLSNPFGTAPPAGPPTSLQAFQNGLPTLTTLSQCTTSNINNCSPASPFLFGGYDTRNKLPYSENWNLDVQWQATNTTVVNVAYIGNHGLHETLPIPFNMPQIATAQNPVNGQTSSYGFNVTSTENIITSTGGNVDLRVPFIGYSPNSVLWEAEGVSWYHALQAQVNKRFGYGFQGGASYTWSRTLDEGSGLGLFFNGNNPLNPKGSYGPSDFDRTHVLSFSYVYQIPKIVSFKGVMDKALNGWGMSGITTFQSGQPYSIVDFSGSIGSLFFSNNDFLTNPIVPLAPGFTPGTAKTGHTLSSLNPAAFQPQFLQPGQSGVPACDPTGGPNGGPLCDNLESVFGNGGRNIFRGPFQKRADLSLFKETPIGERVKAKYSLDVFNVSNTPSFDTPNNNVSFFNFSSPPKLLATPSGNLGQIQHTLGSPRLVRMSLRFDF
ncbi:MAG TPA: carboxypeptidase regulatory-like domain-containing protein [Candidatus Angelobacter sp.]|nr:carboxypeptidase regulatory-like domain-containing protein [Candidatus Angelobacter sp.]